MNKLHATVYLSVQGPVYNDLFEETKARGGVDLIQEYLQYAIIGLVCVCVL